MASDYGMLSFVAQLFHEENAAGAGGQQGTTKITFKTLKRLRNTEVL